MFATSKQVSRQILTILEDTILQPEIMETTLTKAMHQTEVDDEKGSYYTTAAFDAIQGSRVDHLECLKI